MSDSPQTRTGIKSVEVRGEVVLAILESLHGLGAEGMAILGRQGIIDAQAGSWYSLLALLKAFDAIEDAMSDTTLFTIGYKIHRNVRLPEQYASVEHFIDSLALIDEAYHLNHQGGEIGHYAFERLAPRHARMVSSSLYPCQFDRGVVSGFSMLARPSGIDQVFVTHDKEAPCRRLGGLNCTYHVTW